MCIIENLPSKLRDQQPWFSRLLIKTKKQKNWNPIEFHLPPIALRTKCCSGGGSDDIFQQSTRYKKSPGFSIQNNPSNQCIKQQLCFRFFNFWFFEMWNWKMTTAQRLHYKQMQTRRLGVCWWSYQGLSCLILQ